VDIFSFRDYDYLITVDYLNNFFSKLTVCPANVLKTLFTVLDTISRDMEFRQLLSATILLTDAENFTSSLRNTNLTTKRQVRVTLKATEKRKMP